MDHFRVRPGKRDRRMDEAEEERPSKQRRVSSPISQQDDPLEEDPSQQLQILVQQLSRVPLSSYFKAHTIDTFVQRITCLLEQATRCDDHCLLAQVHGLLL